MRTSLRKLIPAFGVLALMAAPIPALAQQPPGAPPPNAPPPAAYSPQNQGGIGVGIEGGFSRATLSNTGDVADFASRTGTLVGLWVGGNKNGLVGFTGEFLYVRRKLGPEGDELTQHALEIPAVFHINFGSHSREGVGGYVVLGPVFTINVKTTLANGVAGDNFSSADVGFIGGGGIEVYRVGIEVRGNWGFKTITNNNAGVFEDHKNRSVEILAKFRFN